MSTSDGMARDAARQDVARNEATRLPGGAATAARPGGRPGPARSAGQPPRGRATPRRVRLTASRVDPYSVFKIAFLLSAALAIATVVLSAVLWGVLSGMGVFNSINDLIRNLDKEGSTFQLMDYLGLGRVLSFSVVVAFLNVIFLTAAATIMAFLYNICASLVGGLQFTLSDE